jgi:hypothetical protein
MQIPRIIYKTVMYDVSCLILYFRWLQLRGTYSLSWSWYEMWQPPEAVVIVHHDIVIESVLPWLTLCSPIVGLFPFVKYSEFIILAANWVGEEDRI